MLHFKVSKLAVLSRSSTNKFSRQVLAAVLLIGFAGQSGEALAYACNSNYYANSSGHLVHSPSCGREPYQHTADCRDGSVSFSEHHRGTCSHHGGVAHWD